MKFDRVSNTPKNLKKDSRGKYREYKGWKIYEQPDENHPAYVEYEIVDPDGNSHGMSNDREALVALIDEIRPENAPKHWYFR